MPEMHIRPYTAQDESAVIGLWTKCGLIRPWNNPRKDIERKCKVNPELFLVGLIDGKIAAAAMGGYEGHRGWVNYLAVDPGFQRAGLGRKMMSAIEEKLLAMGCPKLNIQVRSGNTQAMEFYRKLGYKVDETVSLGKRLIED
jgi:ribosomal protein S18 acetylase RimI-like enzyme